MELTRSEQDLQTLMMFLFLAGLASLGAFGFKVWNERQMELTAEASLLETRMMRRDADRIADALEHLHTTVTIEGPDDYMVRVAPNPATSATIRVSGTTMQTPTILPTTSVALPTLGGTAQPSPAERAALNAVEKINRQINAEKIFWGRPKPWPSGQ